VGRPEVGIEAATIVAEAAGAGEVGAAEDLGGEDGRAALEANSLQTRTMATTAVAAAVCSVQAQSINHSTSRVILQNILRRSHAPTWAGAAICPMCPTAGQARSTVSWPPLRIIFRALVARVGNRTGRSSLRRSGSLST
jgi:hypothetical protein